MIGKTINHYNIIDKLGDGGMGVVYKAQDTKLRRTVALKFLPPDLFQNPDSKQRFIREAQVASALQHNNLCVIHDIDETDDGQLYICMEYYEGETLKKKIKDQRLQIKEVVDIAIQIANGLARAHELNIIHRDLKPANIIITDRGEVKIVDFGLAKFAGQNKLTKIGSTLGTTAYMSPEQVWDKSIDLRTDIWSLGIVLYEMVTQEVPFQGDVDQAVIHAILKKEPKPVSTFRQDIPNSLEQIIEKCLEKDPNKRFQHVSEVRYSLTSVKGTEYKDTDSLFCQKRKSSNVTVMLSTLLFFVLFVLYIFCPKSTKDNQRFVIAVLPFENLSTNPENEYFSEGISEDIRAELSNIRYFKILSRTSVMQYKEETMNLREMAKNLNAGAILEGSVRRNEDRVRIVTQLIETETEERLWGETYDQKITDIFDIQMDIARKIAMALKGQLTSQVKECIDGRLTIMPAAYYYRRDREVHPCYYSVQFNY